MSKRFSFNKSILTKTNNLTVESSPQSHSSHDPSIFVVWNVGQGLWTTLIEKNLCIHIDAGGEYFPKKLILDNCFQKQNYLLITHFDWDHIRFISFLKTFPSLCWAYKKIPSLSQMKKKLLQSLRSCPISLISQLPIKQLTPPSFPHKRLREGQTAKISNASKIIPLLKRANELSIGYVLKQKVLITGDQTQKGELQWLSQIPYSIEWLVLGHHGSRTSTHIRLLGHFNTLKGAIASARKARYGHPHKEVLLKLIRSHTPLLRTEEWGSIFIEL